MKKSKLLIVMFILFLGFTPIFSQGKYGPDSAECIKYLSYYKEYYKQKNYDAALPHWRNAYKLCPPTANQTMLIDGTSLLRYLITKNKANDIYRESLVDSLLTIHNTRAEFYSKYASTAMNNKGLDIINYLSKEDTKLYNGTKEIIEFNKEKTKPQIFVFMVKSSIDLFKKGINGADQVLDDYQIAMTYMDQIVAKTPSAINSKIKTDIESLFISSNVASCESLLALFTPRYEANPNDIELSKKIVKMLSSVGECMDNDLFLNAATGVHKMEPSYTSAYFLYKLYSGNNEVDKAVSYLEEAINFPESTPVEDAQYCLELATYLYKNGNSVKSHEYALKAIGLDASVKGKAYMLCGTIWGSMSCKGNEVETRAHFWVAVDYMIKAKNADETLTADANSLISQYRVYYPQAAEAFMYNITEGENYVVSCGGLRATTTVRTQQ